MWTLRNGAFRSTVLNAEGADIVRWRRWTHPTPTSNTSDARTNAGFKRGLRLVCTLAQECLRHSHLTARGVGAIHESEQLPVPLSRGRTISGLLGCTRRAEQCARSSRLARESHLVGFVRVSRAAELEQQVSL